MISAVLAINLCGCSLFTDNKIFVKDINDSFSELRNQNSDTSKKMISAVYDELSGQVSDLSSDKKENLKNKCAEFCACLYSNAKCNSVKVDRKGDTANVSANITLNDIAAMSQDFQDKASDISKKVSKMDADELKDYLNCTDDSSESEMIYAMYIKVLDESIKGFKAKDYSKTKDIKLTYKLTKNQWNITKESEDEFLKMVSPE